MSSTSAPGPTDLARRALRGAGDDPGTLARAAYMLGYSGEDFDAAIALIDRSLELNPSFARGWYYSGWLRLWAGQQGLAIDHFETALRLNPRDPRTWHSVLSIGIGHFLPGASSTREDCCSGHCKRTRVGSRLIDFSRPVTRISGGSTRHERWSSACGALLPSSCRARAIGETPSTANCICRACA